MQQFLAFRKRISRHRFLSDNIGTAYCAQHATISEHLHTELAILNARFPIFPFPTPNLGFLINVKKLVFVSSHQIEFFWMITDSQEIRKTPPLPISHSP